MGVLVQLDTIDWWHNLTALEVSAGTSLCQDGSVLIDGTSDTFLPYKNFKWRVKSGHKQSDPQPLVTSWSDFCWCLWGFWVCFITRGCCLKERSASLVSPVVHCESFRVEDAFWQQNTSAEVSFMYFDHSAQRICWLWSYLLLSSTQALSEGFKAATSVCLTGIFSELTFTGF